MKSRFLFVLSLVGLALSVYLFNAYQSGAQIGCVDEGCQQVRDSAYSRLFGISIPLYGVLFYAALVVLQAARPWYPKQTRSVDRATLWLSIAGLLFSAWLTYLEVAVIRALCMWCVVSAVLVVGIAILAWAQTRRPERVDEEEPPLWTLRGHVGWGLVAVLFFIGAAATFDSLAANKPDEETEKVYASELLYPPDAHTLGPESAPLKLVIFSDSQCPSCAQIIPEVVAYALQTGRIRVYFRHFPLKGHPYAVAAGEAEEAAGVQGRYWPMKRLLLERQSERWTPSSFPKYARDLGLDVRRFTRALRSREFRDRVMRDRKMGEELGLRSTPVFFLNRRRMYVPIETEAVLEALRREVAALDRKPSAPGRH